MSDRRIVVYRSEARSRIGIDELDDILRSSRRNNGVEGVSGLLWSDGSTFVQALEGTPEAVEFLLRRISVDSRHGSIEVIIDRMEEDLLFGDWAMANMSDSHGGDERLATALRHCPDDVRAAFGADRSERARTRTG